MQVSKNKTIRPLAIALAVAWSAVAHAAATEAPALPQLAPAVRSASATQAMMLGATRAGDRIVAVGDHGVVLLSDDNGAHFRQARQVPVRAMLTSVSFANAQHGWAVGHAGVVLHTDDGGETWALQRSDPRLDQPLFSVLSLDGQRALAVGLWSLLLETGDGGRSWHKVDLPPPPDSGSNKADRNLFSLFAGKDGQIYIAAEQGTVLRSADQGMTWRYLKTGYNGSFWTGTAQPDGTLVVAGMRGSVYRSTDGGDHWSRLESGTRSSLTGLVNVAGGVAAVGLEGTSVQSAAGGGLAASIRKDRLDLTAAVLAADGKLVRFSVRGPVGAD